MDRYLADGFPGERLHVLPAPLVAQAANRPPTSRMLVTDVGYFPHAARHGRVRRTGVDQAIVILCADGAGWCELEGVRHEVGPGDVLVVPPGRAHRYFADTADPWSIWWLHVTGDDVADLLAATGLTADRPTGALVDRYAAFARVEEICDQLARDETRASLVAAAGAAWHLLAQVAAERERRAEADPEPVRLVQEHLREHLGDPVTVGDLAELAGFSTSHFSARFKASTGFSVLEYVKRLRMARARQLLITSDHPVADIAVAVGYPDPFYFSRQFTAVNGVCPRTFRAQAHAEAPHRVIGRR